MLALRNSLIIIEFLAVALLIVAYDILPNRWIINWTIFMLAILGAIYLIQYAKRNEIS